MKDPNGVLSLLNQHVAESLEITQLEVFVVRATSRSNWVLLRLKTNHGITGIGECTLGNVTEFPLRPFFDLLKGTSPFAIEAYRTGARDLVSDLLSATAMSGLEQALWDIAGKALDASVSDLLGGQWSAPLPVYANINRGTVDRSVKGFSARAAAAMQAGFHALKAAPFDGFPSRSAPARAIEEATQLGIDIMHGIRQVQAAQDLLMVDCHSFFTSTQAISVADALIPADLYWFEEPCPPEDIDSTLAIKTEIQQPMAGGEMLFGTEGFRPLCEHRAYDVIMPDIKHCGGIYECLLIADLAAAYDIRVAPHNPSGPLATIASAHVCAATPNFDILEFQWGEADWYGDLLYPPVEFAHGNLLPKPGPGYGVELNDALVRDKAL